MNDDYIKEYENYLRYEKNYSVNTVNSYILELSMFNEYVNKDLLKINDDDVKKYLKAISSKSPKSVSHSLSALKSFYNYLHNKAKVIENNPATELESPKINERHPIYLTLDQSITLLESLDKTNKNYQRDYCILVFFLNCGLRVSELCNIEISKIKGDTLTIIGKGNKERTIYLNSACIKALEQYLSVRDDSKATAVNKNYLFLSARNTPINKRTVEILVKKHISNAGFTNAKYTPHKLRHTAATLMYKHGNVDIRSLQNILGHESISTTEIYTHVDEDHLRDAVNSNPLSNL